MIGRFFTDFVLKSLGHFPAVLVNGARQVGKSTLVQQLKNDGTVNDYVTLDDLSTLSAARTNPEGFIERFNTSVAIDEIQRAPELLMAIKKSIDNNRTPGRFLLTGSANILSLPSVKDGLAGRMDILTLEGLSAGEYFRRPTPSSFVDDLFKGLSVKELVEKWQQELDTKPTLSIETLSNLVFYGGFPEVLLKNDTYFSNRWFSAYQTAYIERDVRDLNKLLDVVLFGKLFRLVGLQSGNLMNYKNLALEIGLDQRTVSRYMEILEITFQTNQLHPWFTNTRKRLIKTPKVYLNDSGHLCHLEGIENSSNLAYHPKWGHFLETWIWAELRKLVRLSSNIQSFFYRTHEGKEVDFILAKGSKTSAIECKATTTITSKHFSGLRDAQEVLGDKSIGVVLYFGDRVLPFSDTLIAVPIRILI